MAGTAAPLPGLLLLFLLLLLPAASAEPQLRFRPPAEAPVRLFTEPELARYDGHQVGPGPHSPALPVPWSWGLSCPAAVLPRRAPALWLRASLASRAALCEKSAAPVCSCLSLSVRPAAAVADAAHTQFDFWVLCAHFYSLRAWQDAPAGEFQIAIS